MANKAAAKKSTLPALKAGEKYIDILPDGKGGQHHLILLPGDESGPWADMMASAKKRGGDMPDRVEQALLYRDHKGEFQKDWYWSSTQYAGTAAYAWSQDFGNGIQNNTHKDDACRCRAVRRVPVQ